MHSKKKNYLCFIPARKGSSRLKNKNLKKINDITLVEITIKHAKKTNFFQNKNIILSSDSDKILRLGKKLNVNCILRSKQNSRNNSTTDSVLLEVLSNNNFNIHGIFILQVTSPLRKISTLKKFIEYCKTKNLNHCLTVSALYENISKYSKKKRIFNACCFLGGFS
jgi:CMP-N-acetylneuraminic acid synthetase